MKGEVFNKVLKLILILLFCLTILAGYCNIRDKSYEKYEDGVNEITYSLKLTRDGKYETKKESEKLVKNTERPSWTKQLE